MAEQENPKTEPKVSEMAEKARQAYPEPVSADYTTDKVGTSLEPAVIQSQRNSFVTTFVVVMLVSLIGGILLGRTVFKPSPSREEAMEIIFGEVVDELSNQFENLEFEAQ